MAFDPSQYVRDLMNWEPVDSNGTCKIYHGCPDRANSSFSRPSDMAEVRNVELHYHMQPDNVHNRTMYPFDPSMAQFERECPVWYFVDDAANETPKPAFNIIIAYHGIGEPTCDYNVWLDNLLGLMKAFTRSGLEEVTVKVEAGSEFWNGAKRALPSDSSMAALRRHFENSMGRATMIGAGEETCMVFRPCGFVKSRL